VGHWLNRDQTHAARARTPGGTRPPRGWTLGLAAVLVASLVAACGGAGGPSSAASGSAASTTAAATSSGADKTPVKIGVFGPLSGSLAIAGQHQWDGAQLAADEINAAGGADGHPIQLLRGDTQGVPVTATDVVNRFLYQDHVTMLLGSPNSPEVLAVLDLDKQAQTPLIDPSGVALAITESGDPWVFRITATDKVFSQKLVDYATGPMKLTKIAILYDSSDYGQGGEKLVAAELQAKGLQPATVQGYNDNTNDFTSQLLAIQKSGAQAVVLWGLYTQGAQILHQMQNLGIHVPVLASSGVTIGNFFQLAGSAANGLIGVTGGFSALRTDAAAQAFVQKFQAAMHYTPDLNDALAYDAVMVAAKAVENAHSLDKQRIRDALAAIQGYAGVTGTISFNAQGDGGTSALLFRVQNGQTQLIQQ
jgi:branched-chain amino acid transport system substrate-binding protein